MTLVLDTGALIGIDRGDRVVLAQLWIADRDRTAVVTSAAVAAQAWRSGARQANLARTLGGVAIAALSEQTYRPVGELLAASGTADVTDAHVATLTHSGDTVLTSDPEDIRALLRTRGVRANVIQV